MSFVQTKVLSTVHSWHLISDRLRFADVLSLLKMCRKSIIMENKAACAEKKSNPLIASSRKGTVKH